MSEIRMTYDLLFDVLRYEKSREELQQLDAAFYIDVANYIQEKEVILLNAQTPVSERELTRIQLGNVKKLLAELYEKRERKIINLALYRIKTNNEVIATSGILDEEKELYEHLVELFSQFREGILQNITRGQKPVIVRAVQQSTAPAEKKSLFEAASPESIFSVRFIKPVPRFLGPELETYGPFEEEDIASLPMKIARVLVEKQRAELIESSH